ncbi:hypothetical protein M407DRAFT_12064 [Tulasnella calospora MUT 4182]|uniref:Uncharacterized protein n=1 Tax=Tulasnella calospora MUT 4182 TaxID=1051891 RepID=A0A0C3Q507_9AGAM|nr:hypothetical protein M407DRAFT_12064 [Tulasnella calospora MUT 4182]
MPTKSNPKTAANSSSAPNTKTSGFKGYSSYPAFGRRKFKKGITTASDLQPQVVSDAQLRIVIGSSSQTGPKSYWKVQQTDFNLLTALLNQYEELEATYNSWNVCQREDWKNYLVCCKAVFCLNAIRRAQGLLHNTLKKMNRKEPRPLKSTLDTPIELSKKLLFEEGTEQVLERIGTDVDLMWGWWIDKIPTTERPEHIMKAVELVKTAMICASETRTLLQSSPTPGLWGLLSHYQAGIVYSVTEFRRMWNKEFPISPDDVVALAYFEKPKGDSVDYEELEGISEQAKSEIGEDEDVASLEEETDTDGSTGSAKKKASRAKGLSSASKGPSPAGKGKGKASSLARKPVPKAVPEDVPKMEGHRSRTRQAKCTEAAKEKPPPPSAEPKHNIKAPKDTRRDTISTNAEEMDVDAQIVAEPFVVDNELPPTPPAEDIHPPTEVELPTIIRTALQSVLQLSDEEARIDELLNFFEGAPNLDFYLAIRSKQLLDVLQDKPELKENLEEAIVVVKYADETQS